MKVKSQKSVVRAGPVFQAGALSWSTCSGWWSWQEDAGAVQAKTKLHSWSSQVTWLWWIITSFFLKLPACLALPAVPLGLIKKCNWISSFVHSKLWLKWEVALEPWHYQKIQFKGAELGADNWDRFKHKYCLSPVVSHSYLAKLTQNEMFVSDAWLSLHGYLFFPSFT